MKYDGKFVSRWRAKSPDALCAVLPKAKRLRNHCVSRAFLVAFQIVDEGLQVQDLFGRQTAYVQRLPVFQPEQIIGTDRKRLGNPNQHVDRRHDVVVFPVADALLRDIQAFAEFHLVDAQRMTELSDAFVKHDNTS